MKRTLLNLKTTLFALALCITSAANAFTAVTSGNWSSAATWGGTAPTGTVSNADIIIPSGITVILDMDVTYTGGLLNTFSVTGTLSSTTMNKLTLTQGSLTGSGNISIRTLMFTNLSSAAFTGSLTVNNFYNSTNLLAFVGNANVMDSLMLDNGSLSLNNNSNLTMMTNSTIKVNDGSLSVNGGVFNSSNAYHVMYIGSSKTTGVELSGSTLQTLQVKLNNNSQTLTMANNTTVNGTLQVYAGKLDLNGRKLTLNGDLSMAGGTSFMSSSNSSELNVWGTGSLSSGITFSGNNATVTNLNINRPTTVKLQSGLAVNGMVTIMSGTLSLESGATLTMNNNSTVHIEAGAMTANTGSFVGTSSYNVEYMGNADAMGSVELTGSGLNNVTVNYAGSNNVTLTNSLTVNGKLDLVSGHLVLNNKNLVLNGTFSQTSAATITGNNTSEVTMNLSVSTTTLYMDQATPTTASLGKLRVNFSNASSMLMIGSTMFIRNELAFVKGKVMINNADLIIDQAAAITGYDDTHYVVTNSNGTGSLHMNVTAGSSFVTFPVGTNNNYSPAYIQQVSGATSGDFMVRTMNDVLAGGYTGWVNSTSSPVVGRTWFIEAAANSTVNMNLKLGWVAAAELNGFNRNTAAIRHFTGGAWDTYASASATAGANGTFELMRTGITSLSPFAVSDASAPLKVKELAANSVNFEVYPNPAKDVVTLSLPGSVSDYTYELTDITGKHVAVKPHASGALDVTSLAPGCYFVKVTSLADNSSSIKRFIKD